MYNIEYKVIIIYTNKIRSLVTCTYYFPRGYRYKEMINNLKTLSDNEILLGDFNANHTSLGLSISNYYGKENDRHR